LSYGGLLPPPILISPHMDSFKSSLAFWASIAGTFISVLGAIQSYPWLTGIGALLVIGSVATILYAHREHRRLLLAGVMVAGRSIDSLNVASLRRRLNRSLVIQEARHLAIIDKEDLTITWHYAGYCRADQETSIDFSIDADNNVPFDKLDCFAYDLRHDPQRNHKIRPILVGPDGISKKICVPFLEPLSAQEAFAVILRCNLPGCMKSGLEYYTATLSFEQDIIPHYTVRLIFLYDRPQWLRIYEMGASGDTRLLKDLRPSRETHGRSEYLDTAEDVPAKAARIYLFERTPYLGEKLWRSGNHLI
jgi:hypothetical protein